MGNEGVDVEEADAPLDELRLVLVHVRQFVHHPPIEGATSFSRLVSDEVSMGVVI